MATAANTDSTETLYDLLYSCQRGQRVAIVGSHTDDDPLRNGLYIEQKEDEDVIEFFQNSDQEDGELLILTGSAGDGKSALLARGYEQADSGIPDQRVNMDATEARRKNDDYSDRLTAFFDQIIDDVTAGSGPRSAIAMNYGLAVDFFERKNTPERFQPIWEEMQASQATLTHRSTSPNITVINLSHRSTYETNPNALGDGLVHALIDRFDPTHDESPLSEAYENERSNCPSGDDCPLQYNIRQLTDSNVKRQLARLFAGWSIATGSYLNPRTIIDNIASLLLPTGLQELPKNDICPVGAAVENDDFICEADDLIWNAVFSTLNCNDEPTASKIDPASHTTFEIDQQALKWRTATEEVDGRLPSLPVVSFDGAVERVRTLLRKQYLTEDEGETILDENTFTEFAAALTFFKEDCPPELREGAQQMLQTTEDALGGWTGRQRDDGLVEFVDAKRSTDYRYLSDWEEPSFDAGESETQTKSMAVPGRIKLMAHPPAGMKSHIPIPISFEMYNLMTKVSEGYTPNATDLDQSHAIRVLHSRLEDFTNKRQQVTIENRIANNKIRIEDGDLGMRVSSEEWE